VPARRRAAGLDGDGLDRDRLIAYCLAKPGAEETYPWGDGELVAKVGGKAFAFIGLGEGPGSVGLKCGRSAAEAADVRDRFPHAVTVSAYIGRHGWNSVRLDGTVPAEELRELVDQSYDTVVDALPRAKRPATTT
jgi:predicted DNA-binding protein (MmcQ/YjbR family)